MMRTHLPRTDELPVLDPVVLPRAVGHDVPVLRELGAAYAETLPQTRAELDAALATGALDELARLAHRIKGGAGSVGAERLCHLAAGLERAARQGLPGDCHRAAARLRRELTRVRRALESDPWA